MSNEYIIINGELYHYGVPGMKWGVRKAKLQAKADAYRNAASSAKNEKQSAKLNAKADKFNDKAAALDTKEGRRAYNTKKAVAIGAATVATALAAGFGIKKLKELNEKKFKQAVKYGEARVFRMNDMLLSPFGEMGYTEKQFTKKAKRRYGKHMTLDKAFDLMDTADRLARQRLLY